MFDRLRKRVARQVEAENVAQEQAAKPEKPIMHPAWDTKGAPVIEPHQLAMMDTERLEQMIEDFDEQAEEIIPQLRGQQDYMLMAMAFIGVLEVANELAVREARA